MNELNEGLSNFINGLNVNLPLVGRVGASTINDFLITSEQAGIAMDATQTMSINYLNSLGIGIPTYNGTIGLDTIAGGILQGPNEIISFADLLR